MKPPPPPGFTVFEVDPDLPLPPGISPWTLRISLVEETSYPERLQPWLIGSGVVAALVSVAVLAFGKAWAAPGLVVALAVLYVGLRGPERNISPVLSPRGRFVLVDDPAAARPAEEPGEETWLDRANRLAAHPAVTVAVFLLVAMLIGYIGGGGKLLPAMGMFVLFAAILRIPEQIHALVNARSLDAPASDRFLALADPRHPLGTDSAPDAAGTPRRSAIEVLRAIGREWTDEEYQEVRRLIGRGIAEDEACRRVRGEIAPAADSSAVHSRLTVSGAAGED